MTESEEILTVFIQESKEQLGELEAGLLLLEQGNREAETINGIFRAAHTIKGASGVVELPHIERFTHTLENVLDRLRNGDLEISSNLITTLLKGCDHLDELLTRLEQDGGAAPDTDPTGEEIAAALRGFLSSGNAADPASGLAEVAAKLEREPASASGNDCWHISVRFGPDVLRNGMDPLSFLQFLLSLGEITHLTTLADGMPEAEQMDPESCYLGFEISLRSHASKEAIERVFEFCRDDCTLCILPPDSQVAAYIQLIQSLPEEPMRLGEILIKSGALTAEELRLGLCAQDDEAKSHEGQPGAAAQLGQILVHQNVIQPEVVEAAAVKQKTITEHKALDSRLIRVQAEKLDQLIDLVGELVIAGASATLLAQESRQTPLVEATSVLSRLVENIRDAALQLRMVQIGETFNKFNRVVRDVSKELNKDIELVIKGGETELDKSVVEKIGDPLMHLIRNAMDHGIEPPDVRLTKGKPARGRVGLNAFHDSGFIVIQVTDDGAGLNRDRIYAKALEKGLIQAGQSLSDKDVVNLIFEPGFSTADKVSNLSGRGVGMDVVHKNIQALRGSVEVETKEGAGSCFTIRLPLTLAIIDGLLVSINNAAYIVPLDMVVECVEFRNAGTEKHYLDLRGEALPFLRLREVFEVPGEPPARENVVVVKYGGRQAGLVVDHLLGQFQTVIKPLGTLFRNLRGIAGSTILGSGEVALILDVQSLVDRCAEAEAVLANLSRTARLAS